MSTTLTTTTMNVPEHIYINGVGPRRKKTTSLTGYEALNILEEMRVPDRVVLAGGNANRGHSAQPLEIMADKFDSMNYIKSDGDVPQTLTADDLYRSPQDTDRSGNCASEASIAIEEDPLRELKLMRRQIGRLASRIQTLEESDSSRSTREAGLWVTLLGSIAAIAVLIMKGKIRY